MLPSVVSGPDREMSRTSCSCWCYSCLCQVSSFVHGRCSDHSTANSVVASSQHLLISISSHSGPQRSPPGLSNPHARHSVGSCSDNDKLTESPVVPSSHLVIGRRRAITAALLILFILSTDQILFSMHFAIYRRMRTAAIVTSANGVDVP